MVKRLILFLSIVLVFSSITGIDFLGNYKVSATDPEIDLWSIYVADPSKVTANVNLADAPNVIDGNDATAWACPTNGDWWIMDLGSVYDISKIGYYMTGGHVAIYTSTDGIGWTLRSNISGSYREDSYSPSISVRYFKFQTYLDYAWHTVKTLRAWGVGGGTSTPPPTPTPTPSGSSSATPTPTGSTTDTPTITGTGQPPIECPNPPCVENPDDPIYTPSDSFNIILLVPNGGEEWKIGKKYKIEWKSTDSENRIKTIALFLSTDGGDNYRILLKQNLLNDGEEEWTIPDDEKYVTNKAKILIAAYGDSIERPLINDESDQNFKILSDKTSILDIEETNMPLLIFALILLGLGALGIFWPQILNFLLNSFITSFLNRFSLLTAPAMGNKKGTGVVYDSFTKTPIIRAMVRIFNAENNKQLESIITNNKGEFSFIVPNGNYYLKANSTEYNFPSSKLRKKITDIFKPDTSDGTYYNLYFGENIFVNKEANPNERFALNINIPMDKTSSFNLEEKIIKILRIIGNILIKIKWPSIIVGTALSVYLIWSKFSVLNFIILDLYLALILYETYRLVAKSRPYGLVISQDEKPIDLAIVRFNQNNKIKATSISGIDGKFTASVNPGEYNLLTKKNGFSENNLSFKIKGARKLEGLDIKLRRI